MVGAGVAAETEAILRLRARRGLGDRRVSRLVLEHGSGVSALRAVRSQKALFPEGEGTVPSPESWEGKGIRALPMTAPDYPARLLELSDPPPLLFLKGDASLLQGPAVAIVGARRATETGRDAAEALGRVLGAAGITVVSGMARGIDGAAHRGALQVEGPTMAVLGSGLDIVYPPVHRRLFRDLGRRGLLVSEFLPTEPALPHHFPKRNRIIAALAGAVVVVEAGVRSGALITVDHGLDLGREILAVPGSVRNPQARGTNALIRDGARLLTAPEAILQELPGLVAEASAARGRAGGGHGGTADRPAEPIRAALTASGFPATATLEPIWTVLGPEPLDLDAIARGARLSTEDALAGLSTLELLGRVRRCPGMRFRRA